ncbi:peptidyl-prolyl cis-trans isomerase-like 2 [Sporodiniella umbellata]|nr:peptidyl-prolyl cis-trans isomerase-like 2 [Sporodiniella umbellata]
MGKWTDKLYITHSEWSGEVGQHSASSGITGRNMNAGFKRLPFYCCSLSLQPFEHPVCTPDGIVFDLMNIIPYIKKYGTNPVTGEKLETKQLIKLHYKKNEQDEYQCPVTFKAFTDHTSIAAIKTTGNVFAYDTLEKLNIKPKHWRDLLTDEEFTKADIIMLQDPHNVEKKDMSKFDYLTNNKRVVNAALEREKRKPINNINVAGMGNTKKVYEALALQNKTSKEKKPVIPTSFHKKREALPYNAAHYTTGEAAESFTSTVVNTYTASTRALIDEEEFMYKKIKKKSYARIITNYGHINVELFSDRVARTCHNFIELSKSGYYNQSKFHRNIKKFMIQGGDPTGTGKGGESIWKTYFPDEIKTTLKHDTRGILSMANKGKDTNGSQFFFTYGPAAHLDGLHTVFGKVVGGMDVLGKLETIPVDERDRPERDIVIKQIQVFIDPFEEYQKRLKSKLSHEANAEAENEAMRQKREKEEKMGWFGPSVPKKAGNEGHNVGKYLTQQEPTSTDPPQKKIKLSTPSSTTTTTTTTTYGNFDHF